MVINHLWSFCEALEIFFFCNKDDWCFKSNGWHIVFLIPCCQSNHNYPNFSGPNLCLHLSIVAINRLLLFFFKMCFMQTFLLFTWSKTKLEKSPESHLICLWALLLPSSNLRLLLILIPVSLLQRSCSFSKEIFLSKWPEQQAIVSKKAPKDQKKREKFNKL